jgi:hypothetical protein
MLRGFPFPGTRRSAAGAFRQWAELVINEMEVFPKHRYDDLTDATTQAIKYIRDNGLLRTDQEEHVWAMDGVRHKPRPKPLYPC